MVSFSLSSATSLKSLNSAPHRWLWAIVLCGLLLRLAAFALILPTPPVEEEAIYSFQAILGDRALVPPADDQRAPATAFFYKLLVRCFGPKLPVLRLGNLVFGTLFLLVFYFWCRRIAVPKIAIGAVFLAAIHPELVFYSVSLWSESLYLLVAYAAFLLYLRWEENISLRSAALLGVMFGAVALVREIGIFLAIAIFFSWITRSRFSATASARAVVFLAAFALTILPWSLEISRRSGQIVLINWMNERRLYVGNVQFPGIDPGGALAPRHGVGLDSYWKLSKKPAERRRLAGQAVIESIREQLPWWPLEKVRDELPKFFAPNSFPAARLLAHPEDPGWAGKWAYRFSTSSIDRRAVGSALATFTIAYQVATMLLGAAGLALLPLGRAAIPLLAFGASHLLPTLVTTACSRYRIPLTPIFLLGAASLLFQGASLWRIASRRRKVLAIAMAMLTGALLIARAGFVLPAQYG